MGERRAAGGVCVRGMRRRILCELSDRYHGGILVSDDRVCVGEEEEQEGSRLDSEIMLERV